MVQLCLKLHHEMKLKTYMAKFFGFLFRLSEITIVRLIGLSVAGCLDKIILFHVQLGIFDVKKCSSKVFRPVNHSIIIYLWCCESMKEAGSNRLAKACECMEKNKLQLVEYTFCVMRDNPVWHTTLVEMLSLAFCPLSLFCID